MEQNKEPRINFHIYGSVVYKDAKTIQGEIGGLFNKQCREKRISSCKKMKIDLYLTPFVKINSK